jgi:hypothetical protein
MFVSSGAILLSGSPSALAAPIVHHLPSRAQAVIDGRQRGACPESLRTKPF